MTFRTTLLTAAVAVIIPAAAAHAQFRGGDLIGGIVGGIVGGMIQQQVQRPPPQAYQPPPPSPVYQAPPPQAYQPPPVASAAPPPVRKPKPVVAAQKPSASPAGTTVAASGTIEVPVHPNQGGTYSVPVTINETTTSPFEIDSGASAVVVPASMLDHMLEDGSLKESDKNGKIGYRIADGTVGYAPTYRLNSISVGGFVVHDITVAAMGKGNSYLLGQAFLKQFKSWSIDYARNVLVLVPMNATEAKPEPKPEPHDQVTPSVVAAAAAAATGWVRLGVSDHECSGTIDPVAFEKANTGEEAHVETVKDDAGKIIEAIAYANSDVSGIIVRNMEVCKKIVSNMKTEAERKVEAENEKLRAKYQ